MVMSFGMAKVTGTVDSWARIMRTSKSFGLPPTFFGLGATGAGAGALAGSGFGGAGAEAGVWGSAGVGEFAGGSAKLPKEKTLSGNLNGDEAGEGKSAKLMKDDWRSKEKPEPEKAGLFGASLGIGFGEGVGVFGAEPVGRADCCKLEPVGTVERAVSSSPGATTRSRTSDSSKSAWLVVNRRVVIFSPQEFLSARFWVSSIKSLTVRSGESGTIIFSPLSWMKIA